MSKKKTVIKFKNIYQLWDYSRQIKAANIEIDTANMILICDCSDTDLEMLVHYRAEVVNEFKLLYKQKSSNYFKFQVNSGKIKQPLLNSSLGNTANVLTN